ncbi:MAG: hypothetical protein E6G56_08880 [Actinobacteria bacterium]|nr:MAG: hypothetical protein E6G56_08880 [Actinomycetota bacterium]
MRGQRSEYAEPETEVDAPPTRGPRFRRRHTAAADAEVAGEGAPSTTERAQGRRLAWRERSALAMGSGFIAIARLVSLIAAIVALVIAAAVLFVVLGANPSNTIVSAIHDAGRALAGPFDGMFKIKDAKGAIALNWGIALVVYLVLGSIVAGIFRRMGATAADTAAAGPRRRSTGTRARAA